MYQFQTENLMHSKYYNSTVADCRPWLQSPPPPPSNQYAILQSTPLRYISRDVLYVYYTRGTQFICPFTVKATSTTLIFVDVRMYYHDYTKLKLFSPVIIELCLRHLFKHISRILKYSRSGLMLTLKLPAWKSFL